VPGAVVAQQGSIKIGFITDLTGPAAQAAKDMVNSLTMYLDEVANQMAGSKVELIVEDSQAQPTVAITVAPIEIWIDASPSWAC